MTTSVMSNSLNVNELDIDVYARGEDGRGIVSTTIEYQVGENAEVVPSGDWSENMPTVPQGKYLWTRTTFVYNDNTTMISYSITYFPLDGAIFTPSIDNEGNVSWSNDRGLPNPETVNVRGPQGRAGSVKFIQVNALPQNPDTIEDDAFYFIPADNASENRSYEKWAYINGKWEAFEQDLDNYYTKGTIDGLIEEIESTLNILMANEDVTYYLTGIRTRGADEDAQLYNTYRNENNSGVSYIKESGSSKGKAYIDGEQVTTGLFFEID